ncbi:hypothetical protein L6386_00190 [bacterium]|nr:hypothetical protein [bacterium]MCG2676975.1 hypothetical protein [bacterium]
MGKKIIEKKGSVDARRLMAETKESILRRKRRRDPRAEALERSAEAWKKKEEAKKRAKLEEEERVRMEGAVSPISFESLIEAKKKPRGSGIPPKAGKEETIGWKQHPVKGKEEKEKRRDINAASIWVFARRLMAREWAKALGKRLPDPRVTALQEEAEAWRKEKEEEKGRIEEERQAQEWATQALIEEKKKKRFLRIEKEKQRLQSAGWTKGKGRGWDRRITDWVDRKLKKGEINK